MLISVRDTGSFSLAMIIFLFGAIAFALPRIVGLFGLTERGYQASSYVLVSPITEVLTAAVMTASQPASRKSRNALLSGRTLAGHVHDGPAPAHGWQR